MVRGHGGVWSTWFPSTSSINGHWTSPLCQAWTATAGMLAWALTFLWGPISRAVWETAWWRDSSAVAAAAAAGEGVRWGRGMEVAPCV